VLRRREHDGQVGHDREPQQRRPAYPALGEPCEDCKLHERQQCSEQSEQPCGAVEPVILLAADDGDDQRPGQGGPTDDDNAERAEDGGGAARRGLMVFPLGQ